MENKKAVYLIANGADGNYICYECRTKFNALRSIKEFYSTVIESTRDKNAPIKLKKGVTPDKLFRQYSNAVRSGVVFLDEILKLYDGKIESYINDSSQATQLKSFTGPMNGFLDMFDIKKITIEHNDMHKLILSRNKCNVDQSMKTIQKINMNTKILRLFDTRIKAKALGQNGYAKTKQRKISTSKKASE